MPARVGALLLAVATALAVQSAQPLAAAAATGPTAVDDQASLPVQGSVRLAGATNDHAGSAAIQPGLTVFPADGQPSGAVVSDGGRTVQVAKHGTFVVNVRDGSVTFTGWTGLAGDVSVRYRIVDAAGATDDGLLSVQVTAGGTGDEAAVYIGNRVSGIDLLANDTPGRNADGTPGTLDPGSVRFADQQYDPGVTVSDDGMTLREAGLGVAALDRARLTFYAYPDDPGFDPSGRVFYTARDSTLTADGTVEHHSYVTRVDLDTYPNTVFPKDDRLTTPSHASVTLPGTLNDKDSNPTFVLRPELSRFWNGDVGPGDYLSADRRKLRHAGRGTWTINTDGTVLYVPLPGFVGLDGLTMFVFDDHGNRGDETLVVTVEPGPAAKPDTAMTAKGVATTVAVLGNDLPGKNADGTAGAMDKTYVRFPTDGQPTGATVSAYQRTVTVPGEGVYTAGRASGAITFDPDPGFVGTARPVTYSAQDTVLRTDGRVVHNPVTATLTVTVRPSATRTGGRR